MKKIFLFLTICFTALALNAVELEKIDSPDTTRQISFHKTGDVISYSIQNKGTTVISGSDISMKIDGIYYPGKGTLKEIKNVTINKTINVLIPVKFSKIQENYNESLLIFDNGIQLRARAYNDGVAFRWETTLNKKLILIDNEQLELNFNQNYNCWYPKPNGTGFFSHHENLFNYKTISKVKKSQKACVPLLINLKEDQFMLFTDINLAAYPGCWVKKAKIKGKNCTNRLDSTFPPFPLSEKMVGDRNKMVTKSADYIAKTEGQNNFPWRAFVLSDAKGLLTSTMLYLLADVSKIADPSWIKPGLVAWDWWNALNLDCVDFKTGVNQQTYMHYIDFASEYKIPYIVLDEGWSVPGVKNLLQVIDEIDMPALSKYATSKNVDLILWMTSSALEADYDRAFEQFKEWNIKGLKIDFLQRDDQRMMDFCYKTAEKAAEYKMLVDYHGGSKPAGICKTWPNVLTIESVQGLEQCKWGSNANPDMAALLPFTRMVVGPMDYTPGAMENLQKKKFSPNFNSPKGQGTRAQQLAMYVVYTSPLQMLSDTPCKYRRNTESLEFIVNCPVTWDETVALHSEVGKVVAVARRKGANWYIGALGDWDSHEISLSFDFLSEGNFTIKEWKDNEESMTNGSSISIEESVITQNSDIQVKLATGGGYAAIIRPTK